MAQPGPSKQVEYELNNPQLNFQIPYDKKEEAEKGERDKEIIKNYHEISVLKYTESWRSIYLTPSDL